MEYLIDKYETSVTFTDQLETRTELLDLQDDNKALRKALRNLIHSAKTCNNTRKNISNAEGVLNWGHAYTQE